MMLRRYRDVAAVQVVRILKVLLPALEVAVANVTVATPTKVLITP